jgi:hypothetical protein
LGHVNPEVDLIQKRTKIFLWNIGRLNKTVPLMGEKGLQGRFPVFIREYFLDKAGTFVPGLLVEITFQFLLIKRIHPIFIYFLSSDILIISMKGEIHPSRSSFFSNVEGWLEIVIKGSKNLRKRNGY